MQYFHLCQLPGVLLFECSYSENMFFLSQWNFDFRIFFIFTRTVRPVSHIQISWPIKELLIPHRIMLKAWKVILASRAVLGWGPRLVLKMGRRRNNDMSKQKNFVTKSERRGILWKFPILSWFNTGGSRNCYKVTGFSHPPIPPSHRTSWNLCLPLSFTCSLSPWN